VNSNVVWVVLEFVGFAALTIGLNVAARARRRRNSARWYPHNDQINPWMPSQGDQQHRHGHHQGGGGGHHHGGWSGGGDGGHHGGWSGGDGGSPGGHHG
jgi:hypothetical protein